ncbi:MAG TPA: molybdopterin-dependent oxidoreductase, partial [Nitrospiria bacterium]|nr:molybdopterin-dependent oxidoreductase [Nitrospiria bacterium]
REVTKAPVIIVIGSDITETHPVFNLRVKEALRNYDAKVIVADPVTTKMAQLASHHLPIRPGSERWLVQGLVKTILDKELVEPAVIQKYPEAVKVLKQAAAALSMEKVLEETGIEAEKLTEAAEIFAKAERGVILFDEGITKRPGGYENVLNLVDLALVSGLFEKEGSGLNGLCEENNEIGLIDMGGSSEFLPGGRDVADADARAELTKFWHEELPEPAVTNLAAILDRARKGEIKALYIVGENPLNTLPASMGVKEALEKVEFLVVQDPFLTETGKLADAVLPATTYAEKEGTFTSMEGKVQPVRRAIEPVGESLPDWEIFSNLAGRMGFPLEYGSAMEIKNEIARMIPGYFTRKPNPIKASPGAYLNNGFAVEAPRRYSAESNGRSADHPFRLVLGQLVHHSGKFSTRSEGLMKIDGRARLQIGPSDAERLGVAEGDAVRISSSGGSVSLPAEIRETLPAGLVFFPEHFSDPPVKDLIPAEVDPVTGVIYHKAGNVSIEKEGGPKGGEA